MTILYGIRNCDTVKKARAWLDGCGVAYAFHDYKTAGVEEATLRSWVAKLGWEALINRSGTTFRKLPDSEKAQLDCEKAMRLMLAQPSMIRRPVVETGDTLIVGNSPERYEAALEAGLLARPLSA